MIKDTFVFGWDKENKCPKCTHIWIDIDTGEIVKKEEVENE